MMLNRNTDREWEKYGSTDPYFGVLTEEKYLKENLTDENKDAFFASGSSEIAEVLATVRKQFSPDFIPMRSLDFGCGVGRFVLPLAEISELAVGVDISESMLYEAKRNCDARSIENVSFVKSDDSLSLLTGRYNFIHSTIVFQHIPIKRGMRIFARLLSHLEVDGVCVLQFTYKANRQPARRIIAWLKTYAPFVWPVINLIRGKPWSAPTMQMNEYDLNKLLFMLQDLKVSSLFVEFTDHNGHLGVKLYFKGPNKE